MIDRKYVYSVIEVRDTNNPKINTAYDGLMILMIVISLIPLMYREQTPLLLWFDRITVVFFIIDYILRWATADIQFPDKRKWVAFLIYPFSWMAVIDLLSILPSVGVFARAFKALRIVRLLKLLRLFRFLRYSHRVTTLLVVLKKENKVLLAVLGLSMFYVLATALFMYNVEMGSVGPDGEPVFDNFFDALLLGFYYPYYCRIWRYISCFGSGTCCRNDICLVWCGSHRLAIWCYHSKLS